MHVIRFLLTPATLLFSILAKPIALTAPIIQSSAALSKRITDENICAVLCKDTGYENCSPDSTCAMAGACVALDNEFSGKLSSIIIDYGHECTFWASHYCNGGRSGHVEFDQASSLQDFDNRANSYACWKQTENTT